MIKVKVKPDSIIVIGHANSGPRGQDIVCAAVSAVVQTYLFTLQELFGVVGDVLQGYIQIPLPDTDRDRIDLLTQSLLIGLGSIQQQYPDKIQIIDRRGAHGVPA